jgi:starch synthase
VPLLCFNAVERLTGLPVPVPGPRAIRRLQRAVAAADAVVVHDSLYATSVVALVAARRAKKPVVLVQHVAEIPFSRVLLRAAMRTGNRLVTRNMLRAADQVVFVSATTREAFQTAALRRAPLTLFNGVDGEVFNMGAPAGRGATRRALGLPTDRRLILFVGRFVEKKGLAVIAALARRRSDLHFALAGRGPIDPTRWNLGNVTVLPGLAGRSLAALYRAADLLLLPSVGEGYPLVIQEAMACGLPVICGQDSARADPGARRWLSGVDIDLGRPEETARRLAPVIDAHVPEEARSIEMARYAAQTYRWTEMASRIVAALETSR